MSLPYPQGGGSQIILPSLRQDSTSINIIRIKKTCSSRLGSWFSLITDVYMQFLSSLSPSPSISLSLFLSLFLSFSLSLCPQETEAQWLNFSSVQPISLLLEVFPMTIKGIARSCLGDVFENREEVDKLAETYHKCWSEMEVKLVQICH